MPTSIADQANEPTLTQKAAVGTAWSAISTVGRQLLSIASVATVARLLGPGAYGIMAMANLLLILVITLRDLGTGTAIIQRATITDTLLSSLFWVNFLIGLLMALLVAGSGPLMAHFFHTPALTLILAVLSSSFLLTSCGIVHNSLLSRGMHYKKLAMADLLAAFAAYLVALTCAYAGLGVWSLVYANVANALFSTLFYWIASGWRPRFVFNKDEVHSVLGFSLNLSGFILFNYFSRNADNIIVGRVRGQAELGNYQMAYNLMLTPLQNISATISQVTFPAFARIQDDNARFRSAYVRQSMLVSLITFPMMAGMGVLADPLIRAVLGLKWIGAITIFQILAPVGLIQSIVTLVGQIYMAKARTDLMFRVGLLTSFTLVLAFLIGVRYGAVGVAAAYAGTYLCLIWLPTLYFAFRLIELTLADYLRALLPQTAITGLMALTCFGWLKALDAFAVMNPITRLLSTSALGALLYVAVMVLFRPAVLDVLDEIITGSKRLPLLRVAAFLRQLSLRPAVNS